MQIKIAVLVSPGAKKKCLKKVLGIYKFFLQSHPVDGKANFELITTLSEILKVPKSRINIISGLSGKAKRLTIESDLSLEQIEKQLDLECQK